MGKQFEREREIERARERNRTEARIVNMENCQREDEKERER